MDDSFRPLLAYMILKDLFSNLLCIKKTSKTVRNRCQIIIDLDEAHGKVLTHEQSAKTNCVCMATITNTVKLYSEKGIEGITKLNRNVNSNQARRKFDGRAEARIIEMACSPAPEGRSRWPLRLLEEQAKIVLDIPVSKDLYKAFPPAEARRILKHLEVHYTPKHGSWLDMAEIERNVMIRQCLSRLIDTIVRLKKELSAWETERNRDESKMQWHFQTGDAREKLISLYPVISSVTS